MRRRDKLKNIVRANILAEQRYLKSKGLLKESPWNGDPNSIWVPDDDWPDLEVNSFDMEVHIDENTAEDPMDSIHIRGYGRDGGHGWASGWLGVSQLIDESKVDKYMPTIEAILALNGGKSYNISSDTLEKNPKTKELANILFELVGTYIDEHGDVEWDDYEEDEDIRPGGKEWKLDRSLDGLDEDSPSEGRTTRAAIVVFSYLSDIPLDKANVRKNAEFIKFIINKCDGDLNKDIDPEALWSEFSEEFTEGVLNEDSDTYFKTLSAALNHVRGMAEKMGYELDENAVYLEFGTGGIPYGQTNSATIPLLKDGKPVLSKSGKELNRAISVSIYRMDSGRYELTAYKTF